MTPRAQLWEEELAILVGSSGAYRGEDVRRMTPEKRRWTLRRLVDLAENRKRAEKGDGKATGPTFRGRSLGA